MSMVQCCPWKPSHKVQRTQQQSCVWMGTMFHSGSDLGRLRKNKQITWQTPMETISAVPMPFLSFKPYFAEVGFCGLCWDLLLRFPFRIYPTCCNSQPSLRVSPFGDCTSKVFLPMTLFCWSSPHSFTIDQGIQRSSPLVPTQDSS